MDNLKIKVLFVDDDPTILKMYKMYLSSEFICTFVDSGEKALIEIKKDNSNYDVMVTDYAMNGMNGLELSKKVKSLKSNLKIIVLSGQINKALSMDFANLHIFKLLDKPTSTEIMTRVIIEAYQSCQEDKEKLKYAAIGKNAGQIIHDLSNSFYLVSLNSELGLNSEDEFAKGQFEKTLDACEKMRISSEKYKKSLHESKNKVFDEVNAKKYFTEIGLDIALLLKSKNISLKLCFNVEESDSMITDPDLFRHVILNLVNNSCDAIQDLKEKWIELCVLKNIYGKLEITVTDSGFGIPNDAINHLFDEGFSSKGENGTGMGLFYAKNFVENYSGRIDYIQKKNTTFRITLNSFSKSSLKAA